MRSCKTFVAILAGALLALIETAGLRADEPIKAAEDGTLIVIDAAGKEQKLKTWKFTHGVRRLGWLTGSAPKDGDKPKGSPEGLALDLREDNSTTLKEGILTLVPLERVRFIDFDNEKEIMSVHVATSDKAEGDIVLTGSTGYQDVNKLTIESEVDKGDLGVASIKFLAGIPKGIRGIRFAAPKAPPAQPAGRNAVVVGNDKTKTEKSEHKVTELQALYQTNDGTQRLSPVLTFKKTLKVEMPRIQKIVATGTRTNEGTEWDVTLKEGESNTLTLLKGSTIEGQPALLLGLVGRVPAGYQLFPVPSIAEIRFEEAK